MRATRALLASLGAGTALVLAGTLAMASIATLIAFSGMPGLAPAAGVDPAALLTPAVRAAANTTATAPVMVVTDGPASRLASAPRSSAGRPAQAAPRPMAALQSSSVRPAPPRIVAPSASQPTTPANGPAPAPATPAVGGSLDTTVDRTGEALGDAVAPVAPGIGGVVEQTTDVVGDVTQATAEAIAALLAPKP